MTSMSDEPRQFRYESTGPGVAQLHLGDTDISPRVSGMHFEHAAGQLPVVTLSLTPWAADDVMFDGLARVQIAEAGTGTEVAEFLAEIDPAQLEKAALNRPDLGPGPQALTAAMLAQLIDWSLGKD